MLRKVRFAGYSENCDSILTTTIKRLTGRKFTPASYADESEICREYHTNFPNKWTCYFTEIVDYEGKTVTVTSADILSYIFSLVDFNLRGPETGFQFKVYSAATWCDNPADLDASPAPSEILTRYHVLTDPWHPQYFVTTCRNTGKDKPAKTGYHFPLYGKKIYGYGMDELIVSSNASVGSLVSTLVHVRWQRAS